MANKNIRKNKSWFWLLVSLFGVTKLVKKYGLNK